MNHYFLYENVKIIEQFKKKTDKFPRFKIWVLIKRKIPSFKQTWVYFGEYEAYNLAYAFGRFIDEGVETSGYENDIPQFKNYYVDDCFKDGAVFKTFRHGGKVGFDLPELAIRD